MVVHERGTVPREDTTQPSGVSPYLRVAWNHDWGAHSLMLGAARMSSRIYDDPLATSDPSTVHRFTDWSVDGQYQYLADAKGLTAQLVYEHSRHRYPDFLAAQALSVPVDGNLSGNPGTRDLTYEVFWTPVPTLRVGAQYTAYRRVDGASRNDDGFGRDARDNDTLFLYLWAAY